MNSSFKATLLFSLLLSPLILTAQESRRFVARLSASSEAPPASSTHVGVGTFILTTNNLKGWAGMYLTNFFWPASGGIYGPAAAGQSGALQFDLGHWVGEEPWPSGGDPGSVGYPIDLTLSTRQTSDLEAGLFYVNITSSNFPSGEIRGQILPDGIRWHRTTNGPPVAGFALNPPQPTTTNTINFLAGAGGQAFVNYCYASVSVGSPSITVDSTNWSITVSFSPPLTNVACPQIVEPVSGVEGELGPLKAGIWVFKILQNSYVFEVTNAPIALMIERFPHSFRISWPVSGQTFLLESSESLSSANWQPVTTAPITWNNRLAVGLQDGVATRFFRLRQQ